MSVPPRPSPSSGGAYRSPPPMQIGSNGNWMVPHHATHGDHVDTLISDIEDVFAQMVDALTEGDIALVIPYRSRRAPQRPQSVLRYPGNNLNEAIKFTRMVRIMELVHNALLSGRIITKRSIYYQDLNLFKNQVNVDQLVDDLACTLGVGRSSLNIVAASKGLVAGPLKLVMANNTMIACDSADDGYYNVPSIGKIHQIEFGETRWILVIEKEATFRTLSTSQYWRNCIHGQGLIVTGKGYADLATLKFLNLIHAMRPLMPILCVVDYDPHGIEIMRTYKYGSRNLGHEENARIPELQWLGIKMNDVMENFGWSASKDSSLRSPSSHKRLPLGTPVSRPKINLEASKASRPSRPASDTLLSLTHADRKVGQRIFRALMASNEDLKEEDLEQLRELQVMMMLGMKAEIQVIDDMGDLSKWLDEKIGLA